MLCCATRAWRDATPEAMSILGKICCPTALPPAHSPNREPSVGEMPSLTVDRLARPSTCRASTRLSGWRRSEKVVSERTCGRMEP